MKPWRPVEEMDHDEIRRYAKDLLQKWGSSVVVDEEIKAYIDEAAARMEQLGLQREGERNADRP